MPTYIYIEASKFSEAPIGFLHVKVGARDEQDAYRKGAALMARLAREEEYDPSCRPEFLNDYVVRLDEEGE